MQAVYLNPLTDFGFKKLFGEEPHKDLLISFLNTLLPEKHQIATLQYTKNEYQGVSPTDRKAIFDLNCISNTGERFIVELQKVKQVYFKDRSIYYSTFAIQEQAQRSDKVCFTSCSKLRKLPNSIRKNAKPTKTA